MFISYAASDRRLVERIRDELFRSGIELAEDAWETTDRRDWMSWIGRAISTSDVVVAILSPEATASPGVETELALAHDLDRLGAELIPVLAVPTELPDAVRERALVDFTSDFNSGIRTLLEQIQTVTRSNFSGMTPRDFEHLVADLLETVGFSLEEERDNPDKVDLRARYERADPFGIPETEVWLVQTKLYSHQRVSVEAVRRLATLVSSAPSRTRGLFVTNTQLTSVAQKYITELELNPGVILRALDGIQLKRLLRQFPAVATRHFGGGTGAKD